MVCAFFGYTDSPDDLRSELKRAIIHVIENYKVDQFYVGYNGSFDLMTVSVLKELMETYDITYYMVYTVLNPSETLICDRNGECTESPEKLNKISPRSSVFRCNKWILSRADILISYVGHSWGINAAGFVKLAEKEGIKIVSIGGEN